MNRLVATICAVLVPVTLAIGGCGDDGNGGSGGSGDSGRPADAGGGEVDRPVTVSGPVEIHPVTAELDSDATLENAQVSMFTAVSILGPNPSPLEFDTGDGRGPAVQTFTTTDSMASYEFEDLETGPIESGLVAVVDDAAEGGDTFVRTGTAIRDAEDFEGDVDSEDVPLAAYAVSQSTLDTLVEIAGATTEEWLSEGLMIGRFVDTEGNPVADVRIGTASGQNFAGPLDDAVYPNSDFTEVTTGDGGGATSENGVFVVPNQDLDIFGGTRTSTGEDSLDTQSQQGATVSDTIFTIQLTVAPGEG